MSERPRALRTVFVRWRCAFLYRIRRAGPENPAYRFAPAASIAPFVNTQ
jgi:hypothetical protein